MAEKSLKQFRRFISGAKSTLLEAGSIAFFPISEFDAIHLNLFQLDPKSIMTWRKRAEMVAIETDKHTKRQPEAFVIISSAVNFNR